MIVRRRAGGHEHAVPLIGLEAGQRVLQRRQIGQRAQPPLAGVSDRPDAPLCTWPTDEEPLEKKNFTWPPITSLSASPPPRYGMWLIWAPVHAPEQFEAQVLQRAVAGRGEIEPARRRLGELDHVGDGLGRNRRRGPAACSAPARPGTPAGNPCRSRTRAWDRATGFTENAVAS